MLFLLIDMHGQCDDWHKQHFLYLECGKILLKISIKITSIYRYLIKIYFIYLLMSTHYKY